MNIRRPIYEKLATITVSTDSATPSQVAEEILAHLAPQKGAK
jgi:shikimate kinase